MSDIRVFVGHSFVDEDSAVVSCFLEYFKRLASTLPNFSWKNAQAASPQDLDDKVFALMSEANTFIAICTRKERIVREGTFFTLQSKEWKTSDWVIQEIGLAKGLERKIIVLIEDGVRTPGGLIGNLNYITFPRSKPEKAFNEILEMISNMAPKPAIPQLSTTGTQIESAKPALGNPKNDNSSKTAHHAENGNYIPKPDWTRDRYEEAFFGSVFDGQQSIADDISRTYLATQEGQKPEFKATWVAFCEFFQLVYGKGKGSLGGLKAIAEENRSSGGAWAYLGMGYAHYDDYANAADAYTHAASIESDPPKQLRWLSQAAMMNGEMGSFSTAEIIVAEMKSKVSSHRVGEAVLLSTLRALASAKKDDETLFALMEYAVNRDASDIDTRFSLAYKHSELGHNDLALFHYLKIPNSQRSPVA